MITLPEEIMAVLVAFTPVFSERIWDWVQVLVAGAILAPKKRTVTSILPSSNVLCWSHIARPKMKQPAGFVTRHHDRQTH